MLCVRGNGRNWIVGGDMKVKALMTQWGVGHGGFHSGEVRILDCRHPVSLNYIFDCGSKAYKSVLPPQVDRFIAALGESNTRHIDALYISHFDADHVNGFTYLSTQLRRRGIRIAKVWAPFLTLAQRLALIASQEGRVSSSYANLVLEPKETLERLFEGAATFTGCQGSAHRRPPGASGRAGQTDPCRFAHRAGSPLRTWRSPGCGTP